MPECQNKFTKIDAGERERERHVTHSNTMDRPI